MAEDERTEGPAPAPLASELLQTIKEQKAAMVEQGSTIGYLQKQNADLEMAMKVEKGNRQEAEKSRRTWQEKNKVLDHIINQLEKTNRLHARIIEKLLGDEDLEL